VTRPRAHEKTIRAVERSASRLTTASYRHMDEHLPWYAQLTAQERSWVGLVVQAGFASFVEWYLNGGEAHNSATAVFAAAPRALTRAITLNHTLDLLRTVVDVVEDSIPELATTPRDEEALREALLRYSRDIAFAAAQVYATAAEARGAWDARLESLIVDAVLRGEDDQDVVGRATALGWGDVEHVTVLMGAAPQDNEALAVDRLRTTAARAGVEALVAVQGRRLVAVLGGTPQLDGLASALTEHFGPGPVVLGPTVAHIAAAARSARQAEAGLRAAPAWPDAPRPVVSGELLPERVLSGDDQARGWLIEQVYRPLAEASGGSLARTAEAYLASGRHLEATARALFVHPNTVRYRLGRIAQVSGYDLTDAREAYVVQTAIAVARLAEAGHGHPRPL